MRNTLKSLARNKINQGLSVQVRHVI